MVSKRELQRPSLPSLGEGSMDRRKLAEVAGHSGGVTAAARGQGCAKQLEKPYSSRTRNRRKQGSRITGETRKSAERREGGGGPVVAEKRRNGRGAKRPCCG
jgi:hypothetical protein